MMMGIVSKFPMLDLKMIYPRVSIVGIVSKCNCMNFFFIMMRTFKDKFLFLFVYKRKM